MNLDSDTQSFLVIDPVASRHAGYRELLSDLVGEVVTSVPDGAPLLARARAYIGVLVHLDGLERSSLESILLGFGQAETGRPALPMLLVCSDLGCLPEMVRQAPGPFDFLPAPIVPELLRSKVGLLGELARARAALSIGEAEVAMLGRQINEHVHRTKNLLAILQSIVLRTVTEGRATGVARDVLIGRLRVLARAYQLVIAAEGRGVDVLDIVEAELREIGGRATVSGPPIRLSASVVQTLALAIHELADNALRHGALTAPGGSISIGWSYFECGSERYLDIVWKERDGPPVAAPSQFGFGLALVSSLAGTVPAPSLDFDVAGLRCGMRLNYDLIVSH